MAVKTSKKLEIDPQVKEIINEEMLKFGKYLPTLQDVRMFERKNKEAWANIDARLKEINNGRADDTAAE